METDTASVRNQLSKKTPNEIQAFYEARIAQELAALASTKLPNLRERHESARRRWQDLLDLHLNTRLVSQDAPAELGNFYPSL